MVAVWLAGEPTYHLIDHNHFADRAPLGENGGETIQAGDSKTWTTNCRATIEYNLFERCSGEAEIISNKSCENTYRYNTFVECEGALTLRCGNRCVVEGNYFLGRGKRLTGGVRVIGEDQRVFNNYFAELTGKDSRAALCVMNGIPDTPPSGYYQVKNAIIAFNTFVRCETNILMGWSYAGGVLPPENCVLADNIVVGERGPLVQILTVPNRLTWIGNIMSEAEVGVPATPGIKIVDPKLALAGDGLWRPGANSPAMGAAAGEFTFVSNDIDGQPRGGKKDVGCDQVSTAPVLRRPLTPADVGPEWMRAAK
jgi:poly(beta-D-mannuronate) lyase